MNNFIYLMMESRLVRFLSKYPIDFGMLLYKQKNKWYNDQKIKVKKHIYESIIERDLVVRAGPFKGLRYPDYFTSGSALIPKFIGSYEAELHPILDSIRDRAYTQILDIGCAEGYYAVGFAMTYANAQVTAYDINKNALEFCKRMANLNDVADRMEFGGFCDDEHLAQVEFTGRGLVFCDAEGYEIQLFTTRAIENLKNCDVLIELHDFINDQITPSILKVFQNTHRHDFIDIATRKPYHYPILSSLTAAEQSVALHERQQKQRWLFFQPKRDT